LLAGQNDSIHGSVFNLGHSRSHSLLDFVSLLRRFTEFEYELVPFPAEVEAIDIGDYYGDYRRFHEATGWEPRVELAEGLENTIRFFRDRV
jgi:nucleoside-diphosphate-sugar epimerase